MSATDHHDPGVTARRAEQAAMVSQLGPVRGYPRPYVHIPGMGPGYGPVTDTELGPTEDPDEAAGWDVPDPDPIDHLTDPERETAA